MNVRLWPRLGCAALLWVAGAGAVLAQSSGWQEENQFEEEQVTLPQTVGVDRVIEFPIHAGSELRFGIDPKTVSVGADGVVRYVLVARSAAGAVNVLYQGLRCKTGEFRTYGQWHAASGWSSQAGAKWDAWAFTSAGLPAKTLARDALCEGTLPNTPVEKMLRELRYGKPAIR